VRDATGGLKQGFDASGTQAGMALTLAPSK